MKFLILLSLFTSVSFAQDKCPSFAKSAYRCLIKEDGDVRSEKANLRMKKVAGKKTLVFTPEEILNEIIVDGQTRVTKGGFKYRSFCKNKRVYVELNDLNIRVVFSGNRRRAVMRAYLHREKISQANCKR